VAFFMRGGQWPAYVIPASGGSPRKLGESGGRLRGWSKDGRHLLVWRVAEPANTLGVLDTANGTYTTILSSAKSRLSDGRLSPDGKWVAFVSGNPEGETTAHIAPFRGAQSVPESEWIPIADGGGYVFWAPDSHSLYFRRGGAFHRQPLDAAARPAGPAEEFYRLDTFRLASPVTNTVVASRDRIFFISFEGRSDIWMTELR
jgi:Tol biopolymer transport system component